LSGGEEENLNLYINNKTMTLTKENFVTDKRGNKVAVLVPIKSYNKMLEDLQEIEDIKAYDKIMSRKQQFIPLDKAIEQIETARKRKSNV
jgi:PHD/YefM family antitoxin component YafN of YafNO toxin-antitoxin module